MTSTDPNTTRGVIRAKWYSETEQRLANDPIILAMAAGLTQEPRAELAHPDGTPRHEFMGAANHEYVERVKKAGADDQGRHLGAVATALLAVLDEEPIQHWFQTGPSMDEAVKVWPFPRYKILPGVRLAINGLDYKVAAVEERVSDAPGAHRIVTVEPVK